MVHHWLGKHGWCFSRFDGRVAAGTSLGVVVNARVGNSVSASVGALVGALVSDSVSELVGDSVSALAGVARLAHRVHLSAV